MNILLWILLATFVNGLIGLIGVFTLWMKQKLVDKLIFIMVAFSAGALLSGAFFHLMPESLAETSAMMAFTYLTVGFVIFFLLEKILFWHHCHDGKCDVHPFSYLILIGDAVHNVIDGLVIAASFLVNVPFGIITTLLIMSHEIPQELGNFAVLVYGGFGKVKSLVFNFLAQLSCIIGGVIGFFASGASSAFTPILLPFAAGGFIYIAASDLIPELHKEKSRSKSMISFGFFIIGVLFMVGIKLFLGE